MSDPNVPAGFELHPMSETAEKFLTLLGPWYFKNITHTDGREEKIFGTFILDKHTNIWGSAHGGMLISMADSALGYNLSRATNPPQKLVTVHFNADFISSPKPGAWIHTEIHIHKIGTKMSFADCYLKNSDKLVLRTSAVFTVLQRLQKIT